MIDVMRRTTGFLIRVTTGMVLLLVVLPAVARSMSQASKCTDYSWSASRAWVRCAETARNEGIWLAARDNGALIPAADISLADDIGHNLLCESIGVLLDRPVVASDIAQINVALCVLGVMGMTCLLLAARFDIAALLLAWNAPQIFEVAGTSGASPHSSHSGMVLLLLLLPIVAGAFAQADKPASLCEKMLTERAAIRTRGWLFVGFAGMVCATLVRGAYFALATSALVACVLAGMWLRNRSWRLDLGACRRIVATSAILLTMALCIPVAILRTRDAIWPVAAAHHVEFHGISHNLLIGLGAVDNELGVKWDDSNADAFARKLDPNVEYVTPHYYSLLWRQYRTFWREYPGEMIRVYALKCHALLVQCAWDRIPLWGVGLLSLAMVAVGFSRFGGRPPGPIPHALVLIGACVLIFMLLLQGIATHHARQYWVPIEILFALELAVFADFALWVVDAALCVRSGTNRVSFEKSRRWLLTTITIAVSVGPLLLQWGPAAP